MKEIEYGAADEQIILKKRLSAIGMCMRAGKLAVGPDVAFDTMRAFSQRKKGDRVYVVIEASDTSENTHKRITDKCTYYDVPHIRLSVGMGELAEAVGKIRAVAAVGITDENLYRLFLAAEKTNHSK